MVFQHVFHYLHRLAADLLRLQHIQLLGHSIDLAKTVPAAQDLAAERPFILQRILIQFPGKFKPLMQQLVFFLHETGSLCITQLHIAAGRSHHKIYNERQPVGRLIKQQHQSGTLPQIARCQRNRCQHSRQHTCIEAIDRADQHNEHQPEIDCASVPVIRTSSSVASHAAAISTSRSKSELRRILSTILRIKLFFSVFRAHHAL